MPKRATPLEIRCQWTARKGKPGVYDCPNCKQWTANLPLYRADVCPAKERRTATNERRHA